MRVEPRRAAVMRGFGADDRVVAELLAYGADASNQASLVRVPREVPADEAFVRAWEAYAAEAEAIGAAECLRRHLVQLRFPVARGISETEAYRLATRRGAVVDSHDGLAFRRADGLAIFVHATPAGRIPVIVAEERPDFVTLVQALTRRNEPEEIPASMGACIVAGYNNWSRVAELRRRWESTRAPALDVSDDAWGAAFRQLVPRKELYQDRFILLSAGAYSATPAADLGLDEARWRALSLRIRLEHESTHYYTRRVFGTMRNALLDEFVADYVGIVAAAGRYHASWFLRFMGIDTLPAMRPEGRLRNYRGSPPLSAEAAAVLCAVVSQAARNVERFDAAFGEREPTLAERACAIAALTRLGLELIASRDGPDLLGDAFAAARNELEAISDLDTSTCLTC